MRSARYFFETFEGALEDFLNGKATAEELMEAHWDDLNEAVYTANLEWEEQDED